ncbi:hypothetical protein Bbelb_095480 [Branchiostoma belcheri]|nr:hypothetical protein Bbelb_095480 [Branchiostoma belcheri]
MITRRMELHVHATSMLFPRAFISPRPLFTKVECRGRVGERFKRASYSPAEIFDFAPRRPSDFGPAGHPPHRIFLACNLDVRLFTDQLHEGPHALFRCVTRRFKA